jgi:hypothetical protein
LQRKAYLVSGITSNKPYFDYDQIPDWVDKTKLEVKKLRHEG